MELLETLRATVADFAAREDKLKQDFASASNAESQRRDKVLEQAKNHLTEALAEAETNFQSAKEIEAENYARRKTRIANAYKSTKKRSFKRVEDYEGFRKHKLQTETLQSQRNHETGLGNADKTFVEFRQSLAVEHEFIATLEQKVRKAFGRFGKFGRLLSQPDQPRDADSARDEYQLLSELRELRVTTEKEMAEFGSITLPKIFAQKSAPLAESIARGISRARRLDDLCMAKSDSRRAREIERVQNEFKDKKLWIEKEWGRTMDEVTEFRDNLPRQVEGKYAHAISRNDSLHAHKLQRLENRHTAVVATLRGENERQTKSLEVEVAEKETRFAAELKSKIDTLQPLWRAQVEPLYQNIRELQQTSEQFFPDSTDWWRNWKSPEKFAQLARFGKLEVDLRQFAGSIPEDEHFSLPGPAQFTVPLLLEYPNDGSLLIETKESGRDETLAAFNNVILRLLSVASPGRLSFTVVDPVGLGQSFSGTMHLADYAEHLINSHIWTQPAQIEEKLTELSEHMEKVIQMYLRNEYETIAEYNEQAGNIAEKYHFLVVADFPANFSDSAAKRLLNIATSGARCGVYTLIHWNQNQPQPADFLPDELRKSSVNIVCKGNRFSIVGKNFPGLILRLDPPPPSEIVTEFIHKVGQSNRDSNRVEVPFSHVAPPEEKLWSEETTSELRVPIGRTGATKLQYFSIGKGTRQHALLAGKTGSGKSTLFHVIITNLALWCSPEQVEFYLIDFKKGVEFKCYAEKKLPHARVVAIESDREFGLSVLQRVDEELKRRGDLFRALGVQDLAGYKRAGGKEPLPRSLLMIDEFQEFFVEDDKISQGASVLLDRIVRQGRAFGIHVILGSQTLGGAYTMARTTMGQMVIRIALQCNEADALLIMDDNNPAPRLLSRPGEGIYNDAAGNIQGNSPFQAVWLSDEIRDRYLDTVHKLAEASGKNYPGPIVFEGDAPSDIRENELLQKLLSEKNATVPNAARFWLGAPNSIKGPTEAVFHRQSGNNLLMVGQRDEAILAILSVAFVSLAAQFPKDAAHFILFDGNPPGSSQSEFLQDVVRAIPHSVKVAKAHEVSEVMSEVANDLKARLENPSTDAPTTFVFIHGLQKLGKLRYEEDFSFSADDADAAANPAMQLNKLILEGPSHGIHVIATVDTYNNMNRFMSKKAFSEFEIRVLFQMSANDSASLIDNPRAGALGLHRALFYNEQQGYLELFRPYALPSGDWIDEAARSLKR